MIVLKYERRVSLVWLTAAIRFFLVCLYNLFFDFDTAPVFRALLLRHTRDWHVRQVDFVFFV